MSLIGFPKMYFKSYANYIAHSLHFVEIWEVNNKY